MGGVTEKSLQNGSKVQLASWEGLVPPTHGSDLQQRSWNSNSSRDGMSFYDSTVEYMRNDWASQNMKTAHVTLNGRHVLLFHSKETDAWHTVDALDIDHRTPWKEHLGKLGVGNVADGLMAYNDVSNLRMLPSAYNRGRDGAEAILKNHGLDSPQWKEWHQKHFAFDNNVQIRDFDPETDGARRTKTTLNQAWTEDNKRSELKFDKQVVTDWFDSELKKLHVGNVVITSDDKKSKWEVPLFRCTATGQLVTRDAFDIDHVVPYEQLNKKMLEMNPKGLSKADALNAYNDTSNLRLVSRSANCSHEWELTAKGLFRDKVEPTFKGEFSGFIEKSGPMDQSARSQLKQTLDEIRVGQQWLSEQYWAKQHPQYVQPPQSGSLVQMPQPTGPLINQSSHPDHTMYQKIYGDLVKLHPNGHSMTQPQCEVMASSLVVMAKHHGMDGIDRVVAKGDGKNPTFALEFDGGGRVSPQLTWLSQEEGLGGRSVAVNTGALELMAFNRQKLTQQSQPNQNGPVTVQVQLQPSNDNTSTGQNVQNPSGQQGSKPFHL